MHVQAANAGGVAVSGLEMAQNSMRLQWDREECDAKLKVCDKIQCTLNLRCSLHEHAHVQYAYVQ